MNPIGNCALCGEHRELLKSHIEFPSFVYERLRSPESHNPNPLLLSSRGELQTSKQKWRHLLCRECENNRFNKLGEQYISQMCLQYNDHFTLRDMLLAQARISVSADKNGAIYWTSDMSKLNRGALQYFAISMVWRSRFLSRPNDLGPYNENFRQYLLGTEPFPQHASLMVCIRWRTNLTMVSHRVVCAKKRMAHQYYFSIPGMSFFVTVGRHRADEYKQTCFVRALGQPIFDSSVIDRYYASHFDRFREGWSIPG